ncbi:hypothetical protein [Cupriavidus sp. L7L]|uniref:hypothetical protein n=1 Tax=Cupriavidus sp. L7L TaxID=2546443 RepID=UPI001055F35F|nr:hypothetical protein [Cupriavidus sp. L7L]TDF62070.1 hypothetical protein E1J61_31735 [Cupriavidus sp. L7L]
MISGIPPRRERRRDTLREPRHTVTVSLSLARYDLVRRLAERGNRRPSQWIALAIEETLKRDLAPLCKPTSDCLPVVSRYLFGIMEIDYLKALLNCFPELVKDEDLERLRVLIDAGNGVPSLDQALTTQRAPAHPPSDGTS